MSLFNKTTVEQILENRSSTQGKMIADKIYNQAIDDAIRVVWNKKHIPIGNSSVDDTYYHKNREIDEVISELTKLKK